MNLRRFRESGRWRPKHVRSGSRSGAYWAMIRRFAVEDDATRGPLAELSEDRILAWADEFNQLNGTWPSRDSGPIEDPKYTGETWLAVEAALSLGLRGLPGRDTLPRLLERERGRRNKQHLPPYSLIQILKWADEHHNRTGAWPTRRSGEVDGHPGETWSGINIALSSGKRGLPGGSSLPRILHEERGVRILSALPDLSMRQILSWADEHHRRCGAWPMKSSGPILESPGETWSGIDSALFVGRRSLPGSSSLADLLARKRGVPNHMDLPSLSVSDILRWTDDHHARTGRWPNYSTNGEIPGSRGATWGAVRAALELGLRGLRGGSSMAKLLAKHRGVRNEKQLPRVTMSAIVRWADAHHRRTGSWPSVNSGPVLDAPGETWKAAHVALVQGLRGLPGGATLAGVLATRRGVRNHMALPPFTVEGILEWADSHLRRTGRWPTSTASPATRPELLTRAPPSSTRRADRGVHAGAGRPLVRARRFHARHRVYFRIGAGGIGSVGLASRALVHAS
jgi:hypothetical protein